MTASEDRLRLAAVGDAIVNRRLSTFENPRFEELVDEIRAADASFVNLETLLHDYEGYPSGVPTGTYLRAPPWVADELTWAGFDLFAAATNHADDYSHGGMEATMRELDARDVAYAGLGENLADAREPAFVDTSSGRVALVAACSTFTPGTEAGRQRPDVQGRPGIAPLRHTTTYAVPPEALEQLRTVRESLGLGDGTRRDENAAGPKGGENTAGPKGDDETLRFPNLDGLSDLRFEEAEEFRVERTPRMQDVKAILETVRSARRQADWVVVSLHAHEGAGGARNDHSVPQFVERFARSCIDVGADAFVGHGPHVLRGVEIYDEAPIFYSLGNFLLQNQTVTRLPAEAYQKYGLDPYDADPADVYDERVFDDDGSPKGFLDDRAWWESVLPVCEFEEGSLERVTLHPVELVRDEPRPRRGRPVRATDESAAEILADLSRFSEPYGTEIGIEDGRGVIET